MSGRPILFLDRDGTLNEETPDEQIDSLAKVRLMPGVVPALLELQRAGFSFVIVSNQDGLGTPTLPREPFEADASLHHGAVQVAGNRIRGGILLPALQT